MPSALNANWKLVMNRKGLPPDLRLYLITENDQIYINMVDFNDSKCYTTFHIKCGE